ncbi:MAG TPA: hypothetical protein VGM19_09885 [Armatimonadota bacterium]|jgi:lipopolysaccharide biosynthesis regulator YciM
MGCTAKPVTHTGQYQCANCGELVFAAEGAVFPPCPGCRMAVRWELIAPLEADRLPETRSD